MITCARGRPLPLSHRFASVGAVIGLLGAGVLAGGRPVRASGASVLPSAAPTALAGGYGQLPAMFEPNVGQADPSVQFVARGSGYTLLVQSAETFDVIGHSSPGAALPANGGGPAPTPADASADVVGLHFAGANADAIATADQPLETRINSFVGADPAGWHTNIATYGRLTYHGVYPGVDLVYHGTRQALEYDMVVAPGVDPSIVRIAVTGAASTTIDGDGALVIHTPHGDLKEQPPVAYQQLGGKQRVVGSRFVVRDGQAEFRLGAYDHSQALVIDPRLIYSSYVGGGGVSVAEGLAVDRGGSAYIAGFTTSVDFPLSAPLQRGSAGSVDAVVAKVDPTGLGLVYATYLGGAGQDSATAITVDGQGNAYLTGSTTSTDFPVTGGAVQRTNHGGGRNANAFVAEINAAGDSLVYATYLGGSGGTSSGATDVGYAIAADSSGGAYVAGATYSPDFPVVGAVQTAYQGWGDAFVTKITPGGLAIAYSSFLGGTGSTYARGVAVDSSGEAYVTGTTTSATIPVLGARSIGPLNQTGVPFVAKVTASGSSLQYLTYIAGSNHDVASAIAIDSRGSAYVTGVTSSSDFPTQRPLQGGLMPGASSAGFITKLDSAGAQLDYSTYLGGGGTAPLSIAVNRAGDAFIAGQAFPGGLSVVGGLPSSLAPTTHAIVAEVDRFGSSLSYSTYLGGGGTDGAGGIALDGRGDVYVSGFTTSADFPVIGALQGSLAGIADAFVAKLVTHPGGGPLTGVI